MAAALIIASTTIAVAFDEDEIMTILRSMQQQIEQQRLEIDALKSQLAGERSAPSPADHLTDSFEIPQDRDAGLLDDQAAAGYAALKELAGITFGKGISGLNVSGDARVRYEARERKRMKDGRTSRDRFRLRLRLGGVWQNADDSWEIGAGIATGTTGTTSSTSANQSFSKDGVFQTNDINLDYAYVRHSWDDFDVILGQQKNPWKETTTYMLWDGDVRPVGVTGSYAGDGVFVTGGVYDVLGAESDPGDDSEVYLLAGRTGYAAETDNGEFVVAAGIWHFSDNAYEAVNNFFNDDRHNGPLTRDARFTIADIYGGYGVNVGEWKVGVHGHYAKNLGADDKGGTQLGSDGPGVLAEDEDEAWLIGGKLTLHAAEVSLDYAHIEADSVFAPIKDSDFGDTAGMTVTDVEGIKFGLKVKITSTMSLGWTYMDLNEIAGNDRDGELHQVDLSYKF